MTAEETKPLMVIGGGGHGRVVAEAALLSGRFPRVAVIDARAAAGWTLSAIPCHADEDALAAKPGDWSFIVAIGEPTVRRKLFATYLKRGYEATSVFHPRAVVSPSARLGRGVVVLAGAIVATQADIADGVIVNHNAVVEHDCQVGAFAHLAPGSVMAGGASLGDGSFLGSCASIRHGISAADRVIIGNGAAVTRDIERPGVYAGVPARLMKQET